MAGYARAAEWAEKLAAEGLNATSDPRSVTPPCVFIAHRSAAYTSMCGADVTYEVALIAPGPWNGDAWKLLDELEPVVAAVLNADGYRVVSLRVALDNPPMPCFLYTIIEPVEV